VARASLAAPIAGAGCAAPDLPALAPCRLLTGEPLRETNVI
jgi:hypothetical protein